MSVFSPVAPEVAVVYSPLLPISFRNLLLSRSISLVEVPPDEFDSMGCNVLALKPGVCVMVEGNPVTQERLEKTGCQVIAIKGNEICMKGGGGPTCLTRPLTRKFYGDQH
jgi:N-dimethylarginine dimethylaminohydrolase